MVKSILKKIGLFFICLIAGLYILFLILPFIINPFIAGYSNDISKLAEETCGLKIKIEGLKLTTTPKLTVGTKIAHIEVKLPTGEDVALADNLGAKLSLLPLFTGKIEADVFSVDYIEANLAVKPDGNLQIIDYLPDSKDDENREQLTELPLGLKLSNRLPNIYIKEYILSLIDIKSNKSYTLQGGNLKITDFVLDKKVKFSTAGFAKLDGADLFKYNLKITNYIMPNINLNDLLFVQNSSGESEKLASESSEGMIPSYVFEILNSIKKNGLTADINLDIELSGNTKDINIKGLTDIEKISLLVHEKKLPDSHVKLDFHEKKSLIDIAVYTSEKEKTSLIGSFSYGKNPNIDLNVVSHASINNIFDLIKSVADSVNYKDLETLSGNGEINADFNLKSNLKTILSSGYLKIPQANIKYGLYNVAIDNINADIDLKDNVVNFKNVGFNILSQPLKLRGTISTDADVDMHLTADKLIIKGLLAALGQMGMLKENDIYSGTLSMDASINGNLKNIVPIVELYANNIDVLNKPSDTRIKLMNAKIDLSSDGKIYKGIVDANSINVINPAAKFSLPKLKVTLDEKDIDIADTYLLFDNSRIDITGKVNNYTTKDIAMNIRAKGAIFANDLKQLLPNEFKSMVLAQGSMPVLINISGNDKKQAVVFQILATPAGYFHIADLQSVSGKSMLINSEIDINGNAITLSNTGVYSTGKTSLNDDLSSNISGSQFIKVSGSIPDYTNIKLKGINIVTLNEQTVSVPTFKNSKARLSADITLNGDVMNPEIRGSAKFAEIDLPTIKTKFKDVAVDLSKSIIVNMPLITIDNSQMNAKATVNPNFSNGLVVDNVDYKANLLDSDTLISALAGLNNNGSQASSSSDLGVVIRTGKAVVTKFKSGKIIATSLDGDFNLKNNVFHLKNLSGTAFDGKINGDISCNVINGHTSVDMSGENLNALNAIDATAGIANALSGKLDFNAKVVLNSYAPNFNDLLKSVKGTVKFTVKDGHYLNIGTIDQFVLAGNVVSNAALKAALLPIKKMPVVQNSSAFSKIEGTVNLSDGIATLVPVKSAGTSLAYYVTGKYNIINGYTNVIILGRMGADLVAVLGPLGQLSVSKIANFLPSFGAKTLTILNSLTSDPATEKISEIPALTGATSNYKDFKVLFNGNIVSPSSVKSFKWLSDCDTSELENASLKGQMQTSVNTIKQSGVNTVNDAKKAVEDTKNAVKTTTEDIKNQVQKTKDSIEELKNLKNMFKPKSSETTSSQTSSTSSSSSSSSSSSTTSSTPSSTTTTSSSSETSSSAQPIKTENETSQSSSTE